MLQLDSLQNQNTKHLQDMRTEILDEVNKLHHDLVVGKQAINDKIGVIKTNRTDA